MLSRLSLGLVLALSLAACGDSPTGGRQEEPPLLSVESRPVAGADRYVIIRDTIRYGCSARPVVTNVGTRIVSLDSIRISSAITTVAYVATGLKTPLGPGEETTFSNTFFTVPAPAPSVLTIVYRGEGRVRTASADVPCAGKFSPVNSGRTGALAIEVVAPNIYRFRNTTSGPVEFAAIRVRQPSGIVSWTGMAAGRTIAAGATLDHSITGAELEGVGYFVGELFGFTPRM